LENRQFSKGEIQPKRAPLGAAWSISPQAASRCLQEGCDKFAPFCFPSFVWAKTQNEHMKPIKTTLFASILIALASTSSAQSWLTNGLVAYFPFNGNANDLSGNGYNAAVYGSVLTTDRFGKTNAAYHFAGGQYMDIPLDCSSQKPLTYSFWINQDSAAQWPAQCLVWTGTFDAMGHDVGIWNTTNNLYIEFYPRGTCHSDVVVSPHSWVHVSATYSDKAALYANGIKIAEVDYPSPAGFRSSVTRLGRSQDFYVCGFEGVIDDVRIYNRALSSNEVAQLYAIESPPRTDLIKAVKPSFSYLSVGTNYQLQLSGDLNTWTNHADPFTATNSNMVYPQYWDVDNWGSLFFRLQTVP
jgi:hypothetical protein